MNQLIHSAKVFRAASEAGIVPEVIVDKVFPPNGEQKSLQLSSYVFTQVKHITGTNEKIFTPELPRKVGLRSLNNAKLPKDAVMVVNRLQFLAVALADTPTDTNMSVADYGSIKSIAGLQNGEFTLKVKSKPIIQACSMREFVTDGDQSKLVGSVFLENPFLIKEDEPIELDLELPANPPANTVFKVVFGGALTIPF